MIDELIDRVRQSFEVIADHRMPAGNMGYTLVDNLMSGFAMFSLKDPSVLMFRQRMDERKENLKRIYKIEKVPGDTAFRETLDGVEPASIQESFRPVLQTLEQHGLWKDRTVLGGYLAVSIDATGYYCSSNQACAHCLVSKGKNGKERYHHQMLAAVQVHPGQAAVFPLNAEPIQKQDGESKQVEKLAEQGQLKQHSWVEGDKVCTAQWTEKLIHSGAHPDLKVNFFRYEETDSRTGATLYKSAWITDLPLSAQNIAEMVAVARARWKVENETFNTLKNQGYNLEHSYGHGKQFLASNFALLMMLAFLADQIAQHADQAFQKAWEYCKTKKNLWEKVRQVFDLLPGRKPNCRTYGV